MQLFGEYRKCFFLLVEEVQAIVGRNDVLIFVGQNSSYYIGLIESYPYGIVPL